MATCPPELRRLYRQSRVLPFVGAGASMSVRWQHRNQPRQGLSWQQLVDEASKQLGFDEPDLLRARGTDLQILEYFRAVKGSIHPLINWLSNYMQPDDNSLRDSRVHDELAKLEKCRIFYTTNFDNFLERALELHGREVNVVATERDMGSSLDVVDVVKFHGDFDHPERMVLSERDYEERIKLQTELDLRLRSDVLNRAILFIGYSFRDPNVSYLFRLITDAFKDLPKSYSGKRAYIIAFNPSLFEKQLFNERKIEVIPAVGADRDAEVSAILQSMRV